MSVRLGDDVPTEVDAPRLDPRPATGTPAPTGTHFLHCVAMKQRSVFILILIAVSLVLIAACRDEAPEATVTGTTETASATHPASPGGTAVVPSVDAGTTLVVVLENGSIGIQEQSIPPGVAVMTVENRGTEVHNLFVEGEQISRAAGDPIPAGGSTTFEVVLRPGKYLLYCPILDHRERGEYREITVAQP